MAVSSGAVRGIGSMVRIGVGVTPTWTEILGVESYEFPDQTPDNEDATHLSSPNDTEEAIRGMKKVASWPLEHHYVPGSGMDTALAAVADSGEDLILELTAGSAAPVEYAAYVNSYRPSTVGPKGKMMATTTFTVKAEIVA